MLTFDIALSRVCSDIFRRHCSYCGPPVPFLITGFSKRIGASVGITRHRVGGANSENFLATLFDFGQMYACVFLTTTEEGVEG